MRSKTINSKIIIIILIIYEGEYKNGGSGKEMNKIIDLYDGLKDVRPWKIVESGVIDDYYYLILQFDAHPCAYVGIPEDHVLYNKDYEDLYNEDVDIDVHGGFTYSRDHVCNITFNRWWLGWDYGHYDDYMTYYEEYSRLKHGDQKRWTVEEIRTEVKNVIEQLKEVVKMNNDENQEAGAE